MDAITANAEQSCNLTYPIYRFQEIGNLSVKVQVGRLECHETLREP